MAQSFSNNASTTVATTYHAGDTTLLVASASGFPASGDYTIRMESEYLKITAGQGSTTWTVEGGQEGTTPADHASGVVVIQEFTKAGLDSLGNGYWPSLRVAGDADTLGVGQWRGGMGSGHPPSGSLGDWILDETGSLYYCTVPGSPGTWTRLMPVNNYVARTQSTAGGSSIPSDGAYHVLGWETAALFDPASMFTAGAQSGAASGHMTAPINGYYRVTSTVYMDNVASVSGANKRMFLGVFVNPTFTSNNTNNGGQLRSESAHLVVSLPPGVTVTGTLRLNANDKVYIACYQESGATLTSGGGQDFAGIYRTNFELAFERPL